MTPDPELLAWADDGGPAVCWEDEAPPKQERPTPLSVRPEGIPESLRKEHRWVVWHYVWIPAANGTAGKWDKPPHIATEPTRFADSTRPSTWRSFDEALATYKAGKCDGIGFVLGDGWMGYDADNMDAPDHVALLNTYTERSPSGRGVHCVALGTKPPGRCRTGDYELYDHGRYFTATGHHSPGTPATVEERTGEFAELHRRLFPPPATPTESTPPSPTTSLSDDALIAKIRSSPQRAKFELLWRGDHTDYDSPSEADFALCAILAFWTNRDAERMDRLFRRSHRVDDKVRAEKWDRVGRDTIAKAIAGTAKGYTDPTPKPDRLGEPLEDLHAFMHRVATRPELSWHVPGLIPDEGIALWHGQPRDFKSFCALEVALALACGRPAFNNPRFTIAHPVRVAYFTEEDPERLFFARLRWLTAGAGRMPGADLFFPFVCKGLSFDEAADQEYILVKLDEAHAEVSVFDPTRSFTNCADKGPADLQPVTKFLRLLRNTTTAKTLVLVSHDTKPPAVLPDVPGRSRSQQASGGGIFSISDCPVSFTKLAWNKVGVFPEEYKLSGDPRPFEVTFTTDERLSDDGPRFGSWVRPVAETKGEHEIEKAQAIAKILKFLHAKFGTWFSTDEVNRGAQLRKGTASTVLPELEKRGLVRFCTGADAVAQNRNVQAKLWCAVIDHEQK